MRLIICTMLVSVHTFACSCMSWGDAKLMMKMADSVVVAVPLAESSYFGQGEYGELVKTPMKILKHYKGKYKQRFTLISDKSDGANCGLYFNQYEGVFLIFGYKFSKTYYTSGVCDIGIFHPEHQHVYDMLSELDSM